MSLKSKCDQYDVLVKELFSLLDATEETDEGREFHPVRIVCCRNDMIEKLENVLATLKSNRRDDVQIAKLSPQPHEAVALGLTTLR